MASLRPRTVLLATLIPACSDEDTSKPREPDTLSGTFDFGGGPLFTPPDQSYPFLTRYDLAGAHLSSATYDATRARFTGADRGPDGELALIGTFKGTLDLRYGPLKSVGEQDVFIRRFHP